MKKYRRFKKKYRLLHITIVSAALVMFWWAVWGVLDMMLPGERPLLGYVFGFAVAFLILYLDDFHLKDLE